MEESRESLFVLATLSENCERYEECMRYMVKISELGEPLSVDERNTLSVSCKNVVGKLRSGLRYLDHLAEKKESKDSPCFEKVTNLMRDQIRAELAGVCDDVIALLDNHLIPAAQSPEYKVFYYKMKADYLRYEAEFATGDHLQEVRKDCLVVYKKASEIATSQLPPCNVVRLGLFLNFSVFYYEILGNPARAHDMAKLAFKEATENMDDTSREESRDINLILQLLRDNLTLWSSDAPSGDERSSPARPEEGVAA